MASTATVGKGSLDRGLELFNHLARTKEASTADLVQALGISRSATYRLVERLQEDQYIIQTPSGQWRLGPSIARLAMAAVQSVEVMDVAPELLRALAQQTRESVSLGVLNGQEIVFVYRELGPQSVRVSAELGARRPLHATSIGKAYLSGMGEQERSVLIRQLELRPHTPHTITSKARLEDDIRLSLERGWTEEHQEFDLSSTCCGAPFSITPGTSSQRSVSPVLSIECRSRRVLLVPWSRQPRPPFPANWDTNVTINERRTRCSTF
jgi:IclR family acetate operon transcriptional repressor